MMEPTLTNTVPDYASLYRLLRAYCSYPTGTPRLAATLRPYLPALRNGDESLSSDSHFYTLLAEANSDSIMQWLQQTLCCSLPNP